MNAGTLAGRSRFLAVVATYVVIVASVGCSKTPSDSTSEQESTETPYAASGGLAAAQGHQEGEGNQEGEGSQQVAANQEFEGGQENAARTTGLEEFGNPLESADPSVPAAAQRDNPGEPPLRLAAPEEQLIGGRQRRELAAGLSPEKLNEFLAGADHDMQLIVTGQSGIEDQQQARDELLRIVKLKLQASRRLMDHVDADPAAKVEGARGELQALSHLAALGDLKAAVELETLAKTHVASDDSQLATDSRLVLIGFAIESLQNGEENAVSQITQLVDGFSQSSDAPDVPALMVMGQARQVLAQYGHEREARFIRDMIIDLYADASDPRVAEMAAQIAGNVQFDEIEVLRRNATAGENVSASQWAEAVETLIEESADLQTVQYLAGSALEFEAMGLDPLVLATFESLIKHFDDPSSATGREVEFAITARQARNRIIGRTFDPLLPGVDGERMQMDDYRGKVVLMPFWATGFQESLQLIPQLKAIEKAHGDDVVIVGMNLDVEGAAVSEFVKQSEMGFKSFRAESSPTAKIANPIAAQFGMVSMPFVAIIDSQGRVAAINFNGYRLEETVQELVKPATKENSDAP